MKSCKNTFVGFFVIISFMFCILSTTRAIVRANDNIVYQKSEYIEIIDSVAIKNSIDMELLKINIISEVDTYIDRVAPSNKIDPKILFELCDTYNVDIRFVIAQGQIESHFATKGTAKKTNSIFNVGAYDGHSAAKQNRNGFGFSNPNESIEPYLILLTNHYLVDGKTEFDMMNNYVNYLGMRYASNLQYEKMLKSVFNRINTDTNLNILLKEYKEIKLV